jgi:hypothetical protein
MPNAPHAQDGSFSEAPPPDLKVEDRTHSLGQASHARGESWAEANSLSTLGPRRLSLATGRLSPTALTGIGGLDPC